jgi:hypothetical protein
MGAYKAVTAEDGRCSHKVKVKVPLCLTKRYTMKAYGGSGYIDPHFLDLGTGQR